jgi:PKD repeat protein
MELYNSTNGPNWKNSTGWNQTNTPCSWFGVICSRAGHVNAIELSTADDFSNHDNIGNGNGLTGKIPDLNLPNLTGLSLAGNQLSGNIPNFSNLPKLTTLYLWSNQLSGNIPNFSNLPKLGHLYLWSNRLNGSIPNFNLPDLIYLYLQSNQLSGNIPNFSNLPKLEVLHLENNQLSGSIPNFTAFSLAKKYAYFNNNCGLTAYDAAQESVLNSKDPDWQKRNPNCPVSTATLTMTETGNGTVTSVPAGIDCGATCTANYSANTAVTLTAIADTGYGFSSWSEDCSGTDNVTTVTMDMDKNCTAIFTGSNQQPVASLIVTPTSGPAPLTVTLDYSASYDPDGSIVKYDWNVNGQPISVAAQQKSMSFNTPGTYTISLKVTDNDGLTGETSQIVTVTGSTLSRTLILTNSQKLATLYGPDQANQVMNKLHELANHPNVQGLVIQIENDPTVAVAYASRTNDDDKNQANAVAEAIKQVMLNQWNEKLENIVLVGDDRVIPFYRINDGTIPPDPMTLTDDFYSDHPPINNCSGCANPQLYIPDVPSGRLIENPSQIIGVIDTFLANSTLNIGTAVVTGYDFIQDGAQEHCNTLQAIGIATNCMLIGEVWTSNDFLNQVLNTYHDVTSINGHADYSIFGTPNGFVSASDFANTTIDFSRTIFYSVGCHAGLNVANDLDLPESLAIRRANYVANTGFGWGGDGVILSEELMWNLTKYLIKPQTTLGKAFARAKQQYYADNPNFEPYMEKITAESTLYGLPMYQLTSQATAPISTGISATKTQTTQENGLQKDGYAYTWAMASPIATTSGSSFYSIRGATISKDNEPILPKLTNEVTDPDKALHGIIFRGGNYKTVNATPPMQRFSTTTGHLTPEKKFVAPNWYPSVFFTPNALNLTTGKKEMLVATAGQYNPNLTTGQQRIFNNMDFDVYHHANTNDWTPPTTYLTNHNLQANTATVTVTTSDASGVKEVVVAYTDGKGTWNSANLTENGGTWTGNFAATAETEFFVQAVDKTGNVAVNDNGGEYFSFKAMSSLPALGNGFAGGIAVNSGAYQQRVIQNLADTVEVTGEITVAPTDIGKVADIFIYAAAHFPWDANNTYYYTVGEGYSVSPWDQDPYKLVPFIPNVTLGVSHHVSMWKGTFPVTGTLDIFFGYRLPNGILVSNKQPIEATIQ